MNMLRYWRYHVYPFTFYHLFFVISKKLRIFAP